METLLDLLTRARMKAHIDVGDPRERAIIIRCIEDAICRLEAARSLPPLPTQAPRPIAELVGAGAPLFPRDGAL